MASRHENGKTEGCERQVYKQSLRKEKAVVYHPEARDGLAKDWIVVTRQNRQVVNIPSYGVADVNDDAVGNYYSLIL